MTCYILFLKLTLYFQPIIFTDFKFGYHSITKKGIMTEYEPFGLGRFATDRCYAPQVNGRYAALLPFFLQCRMLYTLLSTNSHTHTHTHTTIEF